MRRNWRLVAEASGADQRRAPGDEALTLWRGRPFDDIADQPFASDEIRVSTNNGCTPASLRSMERSGGGHRKV